MTTSAKLPPHVAVADLQATLQAKLATLSSATSDSARGFLEAAMLWTNEWATLHANAGMENIAPFALVYSEQPPDDQAFGWSRSYFFREQRPLEIGGVVAATTTSMFDVHLCHTNCTTLATLGEQIDKLGFVDHAMLVVVPAESVMHYCPDGVVGVRTAFSFDCEPLTKLTQERIDAELENFHKQHTQYPDGYSHVWHDRSSRTLRRDAEAVVRDALYLHFRYVAFRSQFIVREDQTPAGRTDVSIYDAQHNNALGCLMELKVLRTRAMPKAVGAGAKTYNAKSMAMHARMGVRQAEKYKEVGKPKWAYVCLYDGREKNEAMPDIETLAGVRGVLYRKYYMETSTRDDLTL